MSAYGYWPHKHQFDRFTEAQLTEDELEELDGVEEGALVHWRGELMYVSNANPLELREVECHAE